MDLPSLLKNFVVEQHAGDYKSFGDVGDYPLKGVTYPVDYGYITGYRGEDDADLDLFVGTDTDGVCGYIKVWRPELPDGEHKFYVNLTPNEEKAVGKAFEPVLSESKRFDSVAELAAVLNQFKI